VRSLSALLLAERIVLLHSPSGAGKTSLIQAGLIPQLAQRLRILPAMRLNLEPPPETLGVTRLNRYTLSALLSLEEGFAEADQLPAGMLAGLSLETYLEKRFPPGEEQGNSLLIFDQFEELLTIAPVEREQKADFFEGLGEVLQNQHLWALFAIREDYMGGLAPYSRHIPNRLGVTFRLDLLGVEAARKPIQEPARSAGVDFSGEAAGQLITDLSRILVQQPDGSYQPEAGLYVEPVQLQVVCYSLWQSGAAEDGQIDAADIERVGDVDQALASYYASTVEAVCAKTGADQRLVREWFSERLITPMRIRGQVLKGPETSEGLDNRTLGEIEAAHLVRGDTRGGKTWYELSHDRLVEPVLEDNAAWFESHLGVLQKQAALWEQQERPEALLLRGKLLSQAEQEARSLRLTAEEQAYLEASRRLQRQERRQRWFISALVVLLAVSILLGLIALSFFNRSNRNLADARAANTQAAQNLSAANAANTLSAANAATAEAEAFARGAAEATAVAERDLAATAEALAEDQANRARAGELAATSLSQYGQKLDLAFLLAVQAHQTADTYQSQQALFKSWAYSPSLRVILQGNSGWTTRVVWSPDGRLASASCTDMDTDGFCTKNEIIIWDLEGGRPAQSLQGHMDEIRSLAWSPDGRLASASWDNTIIIWDLQSEQPGQTLAGNSGGFESVAWSSDGRLASGSTNDTVTVWDLSSGQPAQTLEGHTNLVTSVAWSPDGRLASGSYDGTVIVWDLESGEAAQTLEGHTDTVTSVAWSPDGRLASGSYDGTVIVWDLGSAESPRTLKDHSDTVYKVAWSPDGRLASGSWDGTVILWDLENGQAVQILEGHTDRIFSLAWSPDGQLAAGSFDGKILVWDAERRQTGQTLKGPGGYVSNQAWSPDGYLASAGCVEMGAGVTCTQGGISVWDMNGSQPTKTVEEHSSFVRSLAWSPDGRLALGLDDGTVMVWDLEGGRPAQTLEGHTNSVTSVAWSPDGRLASGSWDDTVIVWDLESGQAPQTLLGHTDTVTSVAWSPDGRLASGSWDGTVIVWDLEGGVAGQTLQGQASNVYSVAWSPGGRLASGSSDGTVILWDLERGQAARILEGHIEFEGVNSVAWSPDGRLASGSDDGTAIVWDLERSQAVQILESGTESVSSVTWSPDGRLAVGSGDGTVQVWETNPDAWVEQVCRRAGRDLTRAEWEQYITWKPYERTCPQWPAGE
jgi:WD40 repeat protein